MTRPRRLILKLVDTSGNVSRDKSGSELRSIVDGEIFDDACLAESFLHRVDPTSDCREDELAKVQKQILKYLQVKDKYSALISTVLKSQVFHMAHKTHREDDTDVEGSNKSLLAPIVELPRTPHNKPFIPMFQSNFQLPDGALEEDVYSFSISHQFPFVGCSHLDFDCEAKILREDFTSYRQLKVGLDIVVFEDYNPRLYNNQAEFLDAFRSSFSEWEWGRIHASTVSDHLREFYVRWAMKEAYTKAQGSGMGIAFDSFDIRLSDTYGDLRSGDGGIWSLVSEASSRSRRRDSFQRFRGEVTAQGSNSGDNSGHLWDIYFLPLRSEQENTPEMSGCACICVGSYRTDTAISKPIEDMEVHWTTLDDLLSSYRHGA